jgi:hypothetical protein
MEFEPVQNNYYLQIALEGEVEHSVNGCRATANSDMGVLHGPGQALRMDATAVHLLLLSIDSTVLPPGHENHRSSHNLTGRLDPYDRF